MNIREFAEANDVHVHLLRLHLVRSGLVHRTSRETYAGWTCHFENEAHDIADMRLTPEGKERLRMDIAWGLA